MKSPVDCLSPVWLLNRDGTQLDAVRPGAVRVPRFVETEANARRTLTLSTSKRGTCFIALLAENALRGGEDPRFGVT